MSFFESADENAICIARNGEHNLSSFTLNGFELEGKMWPSIEHYFQGMKFPIGEYQESIRLAKTALIARKLGRTRFKKIRKDWSVVRETVMTRAVYTLCRSHPVIATELLATQNETLVDNSQYDYFWGCGRDRRGHNAYGKILMNVRAKLLEEKIA
jgi:ribA/ribD-fused uncharacterized protein